MQTTRMWSKIQFSFDVDKDAYKDVAFGADKDEDKDVVFDVDKDVDLMKRKMQTKI